MATDKIIWTDKGLSKLLDKVKENVPNEAVKAGTDIVLDLAGESARRAPIESGDLRNDCTATVNDSVVYQQQTAVGAKAVSRGLVEAKVTYSLPYAARQHEDLSLDHMRTDGYVIKSGKNAGRTVNMVAGGESKYLEKPFRERMPIYKQRLRQILKDAKK